jgi:hypothetical protein
VKSNLQNHPRILCYHPPHVALSSLTLFGMLSSPPAPFASIWLFSFLLPPVSRTPTLKHNTRPYRYGFRSLYPIGNNSRRDNTTNSIKCTNVTKHQHKQNKTVWCREAIRLSWKHIVADRLKIIQRLRSGCFFGQILSPSRNEQSVKDNSHKSSSA